MPRRGCWLQSSSLDEEARQKKEAAAQRKQVDQIIKKLTGEPLVSFLAGSGNDMARLLC